MGAGASTGPMTPKQIRVFFDPTNNFRAGRGSLKHEEGEEHEGEQHGCDALAAYCILGDKSHHIAEANAALQKLRVATASAQRNDADLRALDASLGCVLGNVIGDALGAPLEFSELVYGRQVLDGLDHDIVWKQPEYNSFNLKPGQWTDDASMMLCILDSLLCRDGFDPCDIRHRFYAWNKHGYCNAFGRDPNRASRNSVGLGGNISMSMNEWPNSGKPHTEEGNIFTSGNGSVMRNGAIPVWFRKDLEAGMDAAYWQSRTTHRGEEAAECCRLLTFICTRFINGAGRELLDDLSAFTSPSYAVTCLSKAQCEEAHEQNADSLFGGLERRRWDWRSPNHRYCVFRAEENPGYIGSYAMDCMSMALHCVYSTTTFKAATLKAANLCGDSDTVCAVVGQIAGALYGASAIPEEWLEQVQRWDGGSIAARAYLLYKHESVSASSALSDSACSSAQLLGKPHGDVADESGKEKKQNVSACKAGVKRAAGA